MTDHLLPPGIRVGAAIGEDEQVKERLELEANLPDGHQIIATVVFDTTRQARALGALLIKQADIIDAGERRRDTGDLFRVVGGGGG